MFRRLPRQHPLLHKTKGLPRKPISPAPHPPSEGPMQSRPDQANSSPVHILSGACPVHNPFEGVSFETFISQGGTGSAVKSGLPMKSGPPPLPLCDRAVLKKNKGLVPPTETNVHGDALCFMVKTWARHNTTEALLNNGWRLVVGRTGRFQTGCL